MRLPRPAPITDLTFFHWSHKKTLYGIPVGCFWCFEEDRVLLYGKVEEALTLIKDLNPRRFAQIQHDVQRIFFAPRPAGIAASWYQDGHMILIDRKYLEAEETNITAVACLLVHEATHARLCRIGFGYEEGKRVQVERICLKAERAFIRRFADRPDWLEWINTQIDSLSEEQAEERLSDAAKRERYADGLRQIGTPRWMVQLKVRKFQRLQAEKKRTADSSRGF